MQRPHRHVPSLLRVLLLFAGFALTACGGGGGAAALADLVPPPPPPPPAGGGDAAVLSIEPGVFQANANTRVTVRGNGFEGVVELRFLDASGSLLGSAMPAVVEDGGTRLRADAPMLPQVEGVLAARVQVRNGDGTLLDLESEVRFECRIREARSVDGSGNNEQAIEIGQAGTALRRDVPHAYADGISEPSGEARAGTRVISNLLCAQEESLPNARGVSDMFWLWGQFVDHDIDLTPEADPAESFPVPIPLGDVYFDPDSQGDVVLPFHRSSWIAGTGTDAANPRLQPNMITSWLDASNVYGSDAVRAEALRMLDGTGRLRTSEGALLPFNTTGLANAPSDQAQGYFLAGDIRANEQVGLTAMHTLFLREHNRLADDMASRNPHLSGDEIYEAARRYVAAELQVITYREFLPLLLGTGALPPYAGYDDSVDAGIGRLFSTACYRFGHSMVSGQIQRLDAAGQEIAEGHLALRDGYFDPTLLLDEGGIDPVLRGFAAQRAQELDPLVVDDLRNFLFGPPGAGGLDLVALNLQRGRDHALPDYNSCRAAFGLRRMESAADVTSNTEWAAALEAAFGEVDDADVWVVALAEDKVPGAMVGPFLHTVLRDQFLRMRNGDRFWYQNVFAAGALAELEETRLADVIRRNSGIAAELPNQVFLTGDDAPPAPRDPPPPRGGRNATALEALLQDRLFR